MIETQVHGGLQDILDMYMCGSQGKTSDIPVAKLNNIQKREKKTILTKIVFF